MALSKSPYKGSRDFFPKDKRAQNYIFSKMAKAAEQFGYEPYDGPLLEEVELYKAKSGEELINEQIYSFKDRGERLVAIRPEMTPTLARMVAQIHREVSKPIRFYSIPNLMRYEKPQKGRLREHWQLNCDIFGASGRNGEIEILQLAVTLMKSFGATEKDFEILINDRHVIDVIFKKIMGVNDEMAYRLYKIIDRSKKVPKEILDDLVNALSLGEEQNKKFYEYLAVTNFKGVEDYLQKYNQVEALVELKQFTEQLNFLGLLDFVKYDPAIVRGLDYYTGIVFEIFDKHPENRRAICGGGAYANLLQIFDEPQLQGVGFGLGDVTLGDFLQTHGLMPIFDNPMNDVFVSFQDEAAFAPSLKLAAVLREQGLKVITQFEAIKLQKVFPLAEKKGSRFVTLMGAKELENKTVLLKNLQTKDQQEFPLLNIEQIKKAITQ